VCSEGARVKAGDSTIDLAFTTLSPPT